MVHAKDELGEAEEEERALFNGPGYRHALALDRGVAALGLVVESGAAENCLPSVLAAARLDWCLIT